MRKAGALGYMYIQVHNYLQVLELASLAQLHVPVELARFTTLVLGTQISEDGLGNSMVSFRGGGAFTPP